MTYPSPDDLAARHLWRTFGGGLALTPPLCLVAAILMRGSGSYSGPQLGRDFLAMAGYVWLLATLPALFFCWLRLGAMRWLFAYYLARPTGGRRTLVVLGTAAIFEALVLACTLALFLFWRGYIEFRVVWSICTGFSLPWLLAALWASWHVLRPGAATPARVPQPG